MRRLILSGGLRDYVVSFLDEAGKVRQLSIVAGEISTGKTSVLQFIAYCLGGRDYPRHEEVKRAVAHAYLEIVVDGLTFVVERSCVEAPSSSATVHSCSFDTLSDSHHSVEVLLNPPGGENSLSTSLLRMLGLSDVLLREAPTQNSSGTDKLSIRDVLRFIYLSYEDIGSGNLLQEKAQHVVRLQRVHDRRSIEV